MLFQLRCLAVWLAVSAATAGTAAWSLDAVGPAARFDAALTSVAGLALAACAAWVWCVSTVLVVRAGRRPAVDLGVRGLPRWAVAVLLTACGTTALTTAPAGASDDGLARQPAGSVDGLPFPDRPVGPARAPAAAPVESPPPRASHVVRPGESLWLVAAGRLGPGASDAEVVAATAALLDLNRDAVGADPDLIHPGLRLRVPPPREETA